MSEVEKRLNLNQDYCFSLFCSFYCLLFFPTVQLLIKCETAHYMPVMTYKCSKLSGVKVCIQT
jgi:hypothetical protein